MPLQHGRMGSSAELSDVVPANAGTHYHSRALLKKAVSPCALFVGRGVWVPAQGRDDGEGVALRVHPGYDASMTKILIVNPNTTVSMTETIGAAARAVAAPGHRNIRRDVLDGPGLDRRIL